MTLNSKDSKSLDTKYTILWVILAQVTLWSVGADPV